MPRPGLTFAVQQTPVTPAATRADVAMFVGHIARRKGPLPASVALALAKAGWRTDGTYPVSAQRLHSLLGIPVLVESWAQFDRLFDWRCRAPVEGAQAQLPCAIGVAVRRFFRAGGARAWIVRCGDPIPVADAQDDPVAFRALKDKALSGPFAAEDDACPILPGFRSASGGIDPLDVRSWRGIGVVHAVPDTAMLLLPDLPDLVCGAPVSVPPPRFNPQAAEQFRPCATPAANADDAEPDAPRVAPPYLAPRADMEALRRWSDAVSFALAVLGTPRGPSHRRDVMVVASLPLVDVAVPELANGLHMPLDWLLRPGAAGTAEAPAAPFAAQWVGNARLQLAYPWLQTRTAAAAPEGLEAPDGALAALVARTALARGCFRSAAGEALGTPAALVPALAGSDIDRAYAGDADWLGDRLCLFGARRGRVELLSDATTAASRGWRPGGVSRLMAAVLRVCRHLGDDLMFEPSGPQLWAQVTQKVTGVLEQFRLQGAFEGATAAEAYAVVCDRRSMSAADLDAGRVVCQIILYPASPINRIVVTLALAEPLALPDLEAA